MAIAEGTVVETTALAQEEKGKLVKSLRRLDMVGFTVCALVGLDTLGTVASNGAQGFTWLIVLAVLFVLPYALLMSEVGSAFTQEGGPYEWVKMAFGRRQGAIAAVLYWVTNPLWVGGFARVHRDRRLGPERLRPGWLGRGRRLPAQVPVHLDLDRRGDRLAAEGQVDPERRRADARRRARRLHDHARDLRHRPRRARVPRLRPEPDDGHLPRARAADPLQLRRLRAAERRGRGDGRPADDVPIAVARSGIIGVLLYAIPVFGIILVLPPEAITGIGGFIDAVGTTFGVYGGAKGFLLGAS